MLRVTVLLSAGDRQVLPRLVQRDPNGRVRQRAQSVLLLAAGLTGQQVADQPALSLPTVSATRRRWLAPDLAGLPDRTGAVPRPSSPPRRRNGCSPGLAKNR